MYNEHNSLTSRQKYLKTGWDAIKINQSVIQYIAHISWTLYQCALKIPIWEKFWIFSEYFLPLNFIENIK